MADDDGPVWDLFAADQAESDALVELYRSLGGRVEDLSGPQDLVAAASVLALRPPGLRIDIASAAARVGIKPDLARELWAGMGFDSNAHGVSEADLESLEFLGVAAVLVGDRGAVELSRVAGLSARRLAEVLASLIRVGFELPQQRAQQSRLELALGYHQLISERVPAVARLIDNALRHHVAEIARRAWMTDSTASVATRQVVVGFADLVGFTDWTASASLAGLAEALDSFEALIWDVADQTGIEVVKLIGDEVMFAAATSEMAVQAARLLTAADSAHGSIDSVRVGISTGEAISRAGDLFGTVVNEAARLVAAADPGTVLVTTSAAELTTASPFGEIEEIEAKGFREPIRARRLLG